MQELCVVCEKEKSAGVPQFDRFVNSFQQLFVFLFDGISTRLESWCEKATLNCKWFMNELDGFHLFVGHQTTPFAFLSHIIQHSLFQPI